MSVNNILEKHQIDSIKSNWNIGIHYDQDNNLIEIPEQQKLQLHLLDKIENLEERIKKLEEVK